MSSAIFGLTTEDLERKIVPVSGELVFSIGDGSTDDMTTAHALEVLAIAEDEVMMRLPGRYRQLIRRCDGEVLVRNAAGGETEFTVHLWPITGNLEVYLNYNARAVGVRRVRVNTSVGNPSFGARSRYDALALGTDYTVNLSTGVITLTEALVTGDTLWAAYDHGAATRLYAIRNIVLSIAALEVSRRYGYFRTADGYERFENWEASAYQNLNRMQGIDLLDEVRLLNESNPTEFYGPILDL